MRIQEPLATDDSLCHYIKLPYLKLLLESSSFHARRLDSYEATDPLEGRRNESDQAKWDEETRVTMRGLGFSESEIKRQLAEVEGRGISTTRLCHYIVCFRRDDTDRQECWSEYLQGEPGVMLRTNKRQMEPALKVRVYFEPITYLDHSRESAIAIRKPSPYTKDMSWTWENEVRMAKHFVNGIDRLGVMHDLSSEMERFIQRFGPIKAEAEFFRYMEANGITSNITRNPKILKIGMKMDTLFIEIVLSPGMNDADSEMVRNWAKGLWTTIRPSSLGSG